MTNINERLQLGAANYFSLPAIVVPAPEINEEATRHGLVSFEDDWVAATRALIARKRYGGLWMIAPDTAERIRKLEALAARDPATRRPRGALS
jgi:hypothetical protein